MEAKEIQFGKTVMFPVMEEVYREIENKYPLSMKKRPKGTCTIEIRECMGTTKTEKVH